MPLRFAAVFTVLARLLQAPVAGPASQPEVHYALRARLDDRAGRVVGSGEIRYRNTGLDTMRALTLTRPYQAAPHGVFTRRQGGPPAALELVSGDGTVVVSLRPPLAPGDSVLLGFSWEARVPDGGAHPARQGRRFDLIGWYPQLLDPASSSSAAFPSFATFLVQLDVPEDQVIGGTGVPLCGDPGWRTVAARPDTRVTLQRDWYRSPRDTRAAHAVCDSPGQGRKQVTWYAEDVTGVAFVLSPTFRYEEGDFLERPVHALFESGEEAVWGAGLATRRTEVALAWVEELGGRNPWPQLTVAPGFDPGGQAAAMVLVAQVPSQATLVGLLGLMITQQVMAGGAPIFTVGTAAYQAAWFFETIGRRGDYAAIEREVLDWDLDRLALRDEPLERATASSPCASSSCRRMEFMSYQLRRWAGSDAPIRSLYRTLFARFELRPTVQGAFQQIASGVIHPAPDSLYAQATRGGILYDDALVTARREPIGAAGWRTSAVVERRSPGVFPRTVWVVADSDTVAVRAIALTPRESITVVTRSRPRRVLLDPRAESHDWNMLNNQRGFGFHPGLLLFMPNRPTRTYLDTWFLRRSARNRLTVGLSPTAWYSDAGGWTLGARVRESYLDRFELNEIWASVGTGWATDAPRPRANARLLLRNPVALRAPGRSEELALAVEEGRAMARLGYTRRLRTRIADSSWHSIGVALQWLTVTDPGYLDPGYYDDAGTLELTVTGVLRAAGGRWPVEVDLSAAGGYGYPNAGAAGDRGGYGRFTLTASTRIAMGRRLSLGMRGYAGAVLSPRGVPRQRRIPLAGADAYQRFDSPLLRSRGSLLAGDGVFYSLPGGAGVRALDPRLGSDQALGASAELEVAVRESPGAGLFERTALALFADGSLGNGDLDAGGDHLRSVGDAGVGIRIGHRLGHTRFVTRLDFPVLVSRPALAHDDRPGGTFGFRWSLSFVPAF